MCRPASFVLTQDRELWSETTDSHEDIIREHGIRDVVGGVPQILRVEITPPNGDFREPADKWTWTVDQDIMPTWYDAERDERRTRDALPRWIASKIVLPTETIAELKAGFKLAVYGQVRAMSGSAQVGAMSGSAQVGAMYDSAQVRAMYDSAQVRAMSGSAQVRAMSGSAQVRAMYDSAQVGAMSGSAQVGAMYDSAQVTSFCASIVASLRIAVKRTAKTAIIIDRSGDVPVCHVGPMTKEK